MELNSARKSFSQTLSFLSALACALWIQATPEVHAGITPSTPTVSYNATGANFQGQIPFTRQIAIDITSPYNLATLTSGAYPVTFRAAVSQDPSNNSTLALSHVTFSALTSPFTGPNQTRTVVVQVKFDNLTDVPGSYGYQIYADGWPVDTSLGLNNFGTTINATVTPPTINWTKPDVTIAAPVNNSTITLNSLAETVTFNFTASSTGAYASPIDSVTWTLDGSDTPITLTSYNGPPGDKTQTTVSGTGTILIPANGAVPAAGPHTVTVTAHNKGGDSTATNTFTIVLAGPPTAQITSPAANAVYAYDASGARPAIPFSFSGSSTSGNLTGYTAQLNGQDITGLTLSGSVGSATVSGSLADLAAAVPGENTLVVTASNASGTATKTSKFYVNPIVIAIQNPGPGVTYLPWGSVTMTIPFKFTTTASAGFTVDSIGVALDGNTNPVVIGAAGTGGQVAVTTGTLVGVGVGPHTLTVTGVSSGKSVSTSVTFTVSLAPPVPPVLTWSNPAPIIYGTPLSGVQLNATASVPGTFAYQPAAGAVLAAGTYTLNVTFTPTDTTLYSTATATVTLQVNPAPLTVTANAQTKTYGASDPALTYAITSGALVGSDALSGALTRAAGENVGSYAIQKGTLAASTNYTLTYVGANLAITARAASVTPSAATKVYGTTDPVLTGTLSGFLAADGITATYTRTAGENVAGSPYVISATLSPAAKLGNYAITYNTANFTITKANQTITFGTLSAKNVGDPTFTLGATANSGLAVSYTSSNTSVATVSGNVVTIVGAGTTTITASQPGDTNYNAAVSVNQTLTVNAATPACGTVLVRHAPILNGNAGVDGSLQLLLPEDTTLNGNAWISQTFYVPGRPSIDNNGHPTIGSIVDGTGSASPSNYEITLNGQPAIGRIVRRTNAVTMPVINTPPSATGTRSVKLNKSSDSAGDFASVRDLTVNGSVGQVAVPPGTYRDLTATGSSGFTLGVAGATTPAVYYVRNLTLSGNGDLKIVGPVILTVTDDVTFNGTVGSSAHPEWLALNLYSGDLTLNGTVQCYAMVLAPFGTVRLNGQALLSGGLKCDTLRIDGNGLVDVCQSSNAGHSGGCDDDDHNHGNDCNDDDRSHGNGNGCSDDNRGNNGNWGDGRDDNDCRDWGRD
jgi:hypothetical protein